MGSKQALPNGSSEKAQEWQYTTLLLKRNLRHKAAKKLLQRHKQSHIQSLEQTKNKIRLLKPEFEKLRHKGQVQQLSNPTSPQPHSKLTVLGPNRKP